MLVPKRPKLIFKQQFDELLAFDVSQKLVRDRNRKYETVDVFILLPTTALRT